MGAGVHWEGRGGLGAGRVAAGRWVMREGMRGLAG